jgi:hypothetical protein
MSLDMRIVVVFGETAGIEQLRLLTVRLKGQIIKNKIVNRDTSRILIVTLLGIILLLTQCLLNIF